MGRKTGINFQECKPKGEQSSAACFDSRDQDRQLQHAARTLGESKLSLD
jgi:hypothetical protein